jgi:hypothetical protein
MGNSQITKTKRTHISFYLRKFTKMDTTFDDDYILFIFKL